MKKDHVARTKIIQLPVNLPCTSFLYYKKIKTNNTKMTARLSQDINLKHSTGVATNKCVSPTKVRMTTHFLMVEKETDSLKKLITR